MNFEVSEDAEEVKIIPPNIEVSGTGTVDVNVLWAASSIPTHCRYTVYTKSDSQKKLPHIILICHSVGPKVTNPHYSRIFI